MGYIDKKGIIYITGRKKDMIVLKNGKKVFPEELETLINRLEIVKESMIFGMPNKNDKTDIQVGVKIVYNEEIRNKKYNDLTEEEFKNTVWNMVKEVNQTLPTYKYIKHLILTKEELIKTTTQKVKRQCEMEKILNEK